jgi:hypothetical protein
MQKGGRFLRRPAGVLPQCHVKGKHVHRNIHEKHTIAATIEPS